MSSQPSDETELVERAINGDVASFTTLVQIYDDRLRAVAYQMLGDQDAMDDVLQSSYLKAFRKIESFRAEASFGTWLHRIVVNSCTDAQRKLGRQSEVSLELVVEKPTTATASHEDQFATSQSIIQALQTLPEDQRSAVIYVDGQGFSYDEAAKALGTTTGTIASRLNRARKALRHQLELPLEMSR